MEGCLINKDLLPVKIHYFIINAGCAGVLPFVAVYAMQLGIEADIVGYIFAMLCCINCLSRPLIGGLADRFQNLKIMIAILICINIVADMGLNAIPPKHNFTSKLVSFQNSTYLLNYRPETCENNCKQECIISCTLCHSNNSAFISDIKITTVKNITENYHLNSSCYDLSLQNCSENITATYQECSEYSRKYIQNNSFLQAVLWSIFTAVIYTSYGSISSLSDTACLSILGSHPERYGRQRMWGTVGWGIFALLSGLFNQVFTETDNNYNYSPGFYVFVVLFIVDLFVITKLKIKRVNVSRNICSSACLLIFQPKILFFIIQAFFVGVFIGLSRSYLFWYLRSLRASQLLLGAVSLTQCYLGELPFFFLAGYIINKIGHMNAFFMSFVANAVKFVSYYFVTNPYWAIPIEILQGPIFGTFYSAMASYAKIVAPEGTEATVQGIASSAYEGLGVAAGSLLGGIGIRYLGEKETFLLTGIVSIVCAFISGIVNNFVPCRIKS